MQEADLVYFIFLNNVWRHLAALEKYKIPFVFELYPGGGFALNNTESDRKLETVLRSEYFKGIVVSSYVTYEYLLERAYCSSEQIFLIPGCILGNHAWKPELTQKKYYGIDKDVFDVVFAAYRYSETGSDKGYDTFVEAAKILHRKSDKFRFHVVGNFDETILDVGELKGSIQFYGIRDEKWFDEFYKNADVFISPNKSGILSEGTFDGFPTGCGMDALIRQVVLIAADELKQNHGQYDNGKDIYIVKNNLQIIVDRVWFLFQHPYMLKCIGKSGFEKASDIYSYKKQLKPRIEFLYGCMKKLHT